MPTPKPLTAAQQLTDFEKRILVAIRLLQPHSKQGIMRVWLHRLMTAGSWTRGIPFKAMRRLQEKGMIIPDSEEIAAAVERKDCTCHCERWRLTPEGGEVASSVGIHISKEAQQAIDFFKRWRTPR